MSYGCHNLQRGDRDYNHQTNTPQRWGGIDNAQFSVCPNPVVQVAPNVPNQLNIPQHVRNLQNDLRMLGFFSAETPDGVFGLRTMWAVREFQIYSKMTHIARVRANAPQNAQQGAHIVSQLGQTGNLSVYVDSLEQTANTMQYTGNVSGVINQETWERIEFWIANNWRCPVIIEAWNVQGGNRTNLFQQNNVWSVNVWIHDECNNTGPRMFARDFSQYYSFPANRNADDMHVIGDYANYRQWSGPRSVPPSHCWDEAELSPMSLVGAATNSQAQDATFRVIRACSEVECIGHFDSITSYDNAFLSQGPCHWTLGVAAANGNVDHGELSAYLALFRHLNPNDYTQVFEFFGVRPSKNWNTRFQNHGLAISNQRKYACWLSLQDENGGFADLPTQEVEGNYFKTWHWFYRFVMAGRSTDQSYQNYRFRMWDMARIRIRDIMDTPWDDGTQTNIDVRLANFNDGTPNGRRPTIGEVFLSEKAIAMLIRWHIRGPGNIVRNGFAGDRCRQALQRAINTEPSLVSPANPNNWTDAHQNALVQGIRDEVTQHGSQDFQRTINHIDNWPSWVNGQNPRRFNLATNLTALGEGMNQHGWDFAGLPAGFP